MRAPHPRQLAGECDVAIIGAGLAGAALAGALARQGRHVRLFERDTFPRDKLCGEFLSPEAQHLLARLGCLQDVLASEPAAMRQVLFSTSSGHSLRAPLPGTGLGISRIKLDETLYEHTLRCGAQGYCGALVAGIESEPDGWWRLRIRRRDAHGERTEDHRARLVVGAYGRRTRLDHAMGRAFIRNQHHPFVAFKRHHVPDSGAAGCALRSALEDTVELHAFSGGYCGVSFVEGGVVNVCTLLRQDFVRGLSRPDWEGVASALAAANPLLGRRLAALNPLATPTMAVAQIPFCFKERVVDGVLMVGDAAGMVAPLVGDGQAMALEAALTLATILDRCDPNEWAVEWDTRWRKQFAPRMVIGRALHAMLFRLGLANFMVPVIGAFPALAPWLIRKTRGHN